MVLQTGAMTAEMFDEWALLPENREKRLEFIRGEIVELVSNSYCSEIAANILAEIKVFIKGKNLGRVTGADGGYRVSGERYIPDVAFITLAKQPKSSREAYNPNAPDLAVEVLSPTDSAADLRVKVVNYLRAGTVVWVVDPALKQVEVYAPDAAPLVLAVGGEIDGGALLPGFKLAVKDIFPD